MSNPHRFRPRWRPRYLYWHFHQSPARPRCNPSTARPADFPLARAAGRDCICLLREPAPRPFRADFVQLGAGAATKRRSCSTHASNAASSAARALSSVACFCARSRASAGMTSAGSVPGLSQRAKSGRIHSRQSWRIQRSSMRGGIFCGIGISRVSRTRCSAGAPQSREAGVAVRRRQAGYVVRGRKSGSRFSEALRRKSGMMHGAQDSYAALIRSRSVCSPAERSGSGVSLSAVQG